MYENVTHPKWTYSDKIIQDLHKVRTSRTNQIITELSEG